MPSVDELMKRVESGWAEVSPFFEQLERILAEDGEAVRGAVIVRQLGVPLSRRSASVMRRKPEPRLQRPVRRSRRVCTLRQFPGYAKLFTVLPDAPPTMPSIPEDTVLPEESW